MIAWLDGCLTKDSKRFLKCFYKKDIDTLLSSINHAFIQSCIHAIS